MDAYVYVYQIHAVYAVQVATETGKTTHTYTYIHTWYILPTEEIDRILKKTNRRRKIEIKIEKITNNKYRGVTMPLKRKYTYQVHIIHTIHNWRANGL